MLERTALSGVRQKSDPPPEVNAWTPLTVNNLELGKRYIEIMCQMNRASYETCNPRRVILRMAKFPCEYYYLASERFEIACGFKWNRRLNRHRWMSVGFVGAITPREAVQYVAEKVMAYMLERQIDRLIAVEPAAMESQSVMEFYRLVHEHPGLAIRGRHQVEGGTYLWIRLAG